MSKLSSCTYHYYWGDSLSKNKFYVYLLMSFTIVNLRYIKSGCLALGSMMSKVQMLTASDNFFPAFFLQKWLVDMWSFFVVKSIIITMS